MHKQQFAIASLIFLICLTSSNLVAGQVFRSGPCPTNVNTVADFDASKYIGTWHENAKYPFIFEAGGRCIKAEYGALSANEISVVNTQLNSINQPQSIEGIARIVAPGKLLVRFNGFAALAGAADYWILGTDYTNYAAVYSCKNLWFAHTEVVWILTRERNPSEDIIQKAKKDILAQNLSLNELTITDQTNCQ